MSTILKWILGILAVLVVIGLVVGGVMLWRNQAMMAANFRRAQLSQGSTQPNPNGQTTPAPNNQTGKNRPYAFNGRRFGMGTWGQGMPMMRQRGNMMGGRGFSAFGGMMPFGMGFFFLGGLLHLLIPLVILVLVAWLFYALGKHAGAANTRSTPNPVPMSPPDAPQGGRKVA